MEAAHKRRRRPDDRGAGSLEMVLVFPTLLILILAIVQFGLWYDAEHVAIASAEEGAQAARVYNGTATSGQLAARDFLHAAAPTLIENPGVTVTRSATTARATVTGVVESIVPGLSFSVSATSSAPVEAFQP